MDCAGCAGLVVGAAMRLVRDVFRQELTLRANARPATHAYQAILLLPGVGVCRRRIVDYSLH
jgi:hypothetical protein